MLFQGKICGKAFHAMNNFGIANFSFFVIDAEKYIFKTIIFIHAVFITKVEVLFRIFSQEISNIPVI